PAPLKAEVRVNFAAFGPIVAVAKLVLADEFAIEARPDLHAEGLAVPPREEAQEKGPHRAGHGIKHRRCPEAATRRGVRRLRSRDRRAYAAARAEAVGQGHKDPQGGFNMPSLRAWGLCASGLAGVVLLAVTQTAGAQSWPDRTITAVVPFAAGA